MRRGRLRAAGLPRAAAVHRCRRRSGHQRLLPVVRRARPVRPAAGLSREAHGAGRMPLADLPRRPGDVRGMQVTWLLGGLLAVALGALVWSFRGWIAAKDDIATLGDLYREQGKLITGQA